MALSNQQRRLIQRLVNDDWEHEEEFDEFFNSVTDPEELHLFADGFNWDTGVEELLRVIRHPLCDRGTAQLIYWRGHPGHYLQYSDRGNVPTYEQEVYDLLREIEQRVESRSYSRWSFRYDPRADHGHDLTPRRERIERFGRDIPRSMYQVEPLADAV